MSRHVFAICAYKDSPYLEECIRSLKGQTVESSIICCTSTPSPYIERLAERYRIPLYVRDGESNIREDWLFALKKADGELVTIAHQDDRYSRDYVKMLLRAYEKYPDMTVFAGDYVTLKMDAEAAGAAEVTGGVSDSGETEVAGGVSDSGETKIVEAAGNSGATGVREGSDREVPAGGQNGHIERWNRVWLVKKLLRLPLRLTFLANRTFIKRSALLFGNSICCPSCTYHKARVGEDLFRSEFQFALDWDNLYELAGKPGRFVCVEKPVIAYRVHEGATTKACIEDHRRMNDEIAMFEKMWPRPIVRLLMHFYKKAYDAYE